MTSWWSRRQDGEDVKMAQTSRWQLSAVAAVDAASTCNHLSTIPATELTIEIPRYFDQNKHPRGSFNP